MGYAPCASVTFMSAEACASNTRHPAFPDTGGREGVKIQLINWSDITGFVCLSF